MITLKDLKNRVYSGKICTRFEYEIAIDKDRVIACFSRDVENGAQWNMQIVFSRTRDKDSEVYNFGYIMPKDNLSLELIAATGLRYFQLHIKEEIQTKTSLDFVLAEIIRGM